MRIEIFTDKTIKEHKTFKTTLNKLRIHYMNKDIKNKAHQKEYDNIVETTRNEDLPIIKQGETLYLMGRDFNTNEEGIELIKTLQK